MQVHSCHCLQLAALKHSKLIWTMNYESTLSFPWQVQYQNARLTFKAIWHITEFYVGNGLRRKFKVDSDL